MELSELLQIKKRKDFNQEEIISFFEKKIYTQDDYKDLFLLFCSYDLVVPLNYMLKNNLVNKKIKTLGLVESLMWGKRRIVGKLLRENIDIEHNNYEIIYLAAMKSPNDIFKYILENFDFDINYDKNKLFDYACKQGRQGVVEMLLKDQRIDPTCNNFNGFNMSVKQQKSGTVKFLFTEPRIDPLNNEYKAFKYALTNLNYYIIKMFFSYEKFNPSYNNNELLIFLANSLRSYDCDKKTVMREKIFSLLIKDPRVIKALSNETLNHVKNKDYKNIIHSVLMQNKIKDF